MVLRQKQKPKTINSPSILLQKIMIIFFFRYDNYKGIIKYTLNVY